MTTTATIDKVVMNSHDNYLGALEDLRWQGVRHLGWINSGIDIPDYDWEMFYCNTSGSSCLYVDRIRRVAYSVDMGD